VVFELRLRIKRVLISVRPGQNRLDDPEINAVVFNFAGATERCDSAPPPGRSTTWAKPRRSGPQEAATVIRRGPVVCLGCFPLTCWATIRSKRPILNVEHRGPPGGGGDARWCSPDERLRQTDHAESAEMVSSNRPDAGRATWRYLPPSRPCSSPRFKTKKVLGLLSGRVTVRLLVRGPAYKSWRPLWRAWHASGLDEALSERGAFSEILHRMPFLSRILRASPKRRL
jgi:hypothetical protein